MSDLGWEWTRNRKKRNGTYWYDPCVLTHVPPLTQGFLMHSSISSEHVKPLNPFGHIHLTCPLTDSVQVPPLRHGDDAQRFCLSQCFPVGNKVDIVDMYGKVLDAS